MYWKYWRSQVQIWNQGFIKTSHHSRRLDHHIWPYPYVYLFMFTHRAEELKLYQRHILQHFTTTKWESEHLRVITLDKAIRKWVSEWHNLLLSDFDQFSDLRSMHLDHFGAAEPSWTFGSTVAASSDWPPIQKCNEACQNWNKGVCDWEKNCFYLHICKLCFKKGHTSNKCPTKGATGSSGS